MSFSDEISRGSSERVQLLRIGIVKVIPSSQYVEVAASGFTKTFYIDVDFDCVQHIVRFRNNSFGGTGGENNVDYARKDTLAELTALTSSGIYYIDRTNNRLYFNATSSFWGGEHAIVYNKYYTDGKGRVDLQTFIDGVGAVLGTTSGDNLYLVTGTGRAYNERDENQDFMLDDYYTITDDNTAESIVGKAVRRTLTSDVQFDIETTASTWAASNPGPYTISNLNTSRAKRVLYEPKLLNDLEFGISVENMLEGVVSSTINTIQLNDSDRSLKSCLGEYDYFHNGPVDLYIEVNGTKKHVFKGHTVSISGDQDNISIQVIDMFKRLDALATFADRYNVAFQDTNSSGVTALYPPHTGRVRPMIFGFVGPYEGTPWASSSTDTVEVPRGALEQELSLLNSEGYKGTGTAGHNFNREWGSVRLPRQILFDPSTVFRGGPQENTSYTGLTLNSVLTGGLAATLDVSASQATEFSTMEVWKVTDTLTTNVAYCILYYLDYDGSPVIGLFDLDNASTYFSTNPGPYDIETDGHGSVFISDNSSPPQFKMLAPTRDYTVNSTSGADNDYGVQGVGWYDINITLVNGFEANTNTSSWAVNLEDSASGVTHSSDGVHPTTHKVYFKARNNEDFRNHADVLRFVLNHAGFYIDNTSFDAAKAALDMELLFSVPYLNGQQYPSYREVVQDILSTTLGYIYLNDRFEVVYKLFDAPSATEIVGDNKIVEGSTSFQIRFQDVITEIYGYNAHAKNSWINENDSAGFYDNGPGSPLFTDINDAGVMALGKQNTQIKTHLARNWSERAADLFAIVSRRALIYEFDTPHINLEKNIGDDILLTSDIRVGEGSSQSVKIIGVTKSKGKVRILASDITGA